MQSGHKGKETTEMKVKHFIQNEDDKSSASDGDQAESNTDEGSVESVSVDKSSELRMKSTFSDIRREISEKEAESSTDYTNVDNLLAEKLISGDGKNENDNYITERGPARKLILDGNEHRDGSGNKLDGDSAYAENEQTGASDSDEDSEDLEKQKNTKKKSKAERMASLSYAMGIAYVPYVCQYAAARAAEAVVTPVAPFLAIPASYMAAFVGQNLGEALTNYISLRKD